MDSDVAGIEYIQASEQDSPWGGAMIKDSLIVGHSELRDIGSYRWDVGEQANCTQGGIRLPWSARLTISNVTFVNFDEEHCVTFGTCSHCKPNDGGAIVRFNKLTFIDAPNRATFDIEHSTLFMDEDGTLTSIVNGTVLPTSSILDPSKCTMSPAYSFGDVSASVCRDVRFTKIVWNEVQPKSIDEKHAYFENKFGKDAITWRMKSKTLYNGYTAFLPLGAETTLSFENSTQFTNISYNMEIYELQPTDYAFLKMKFKQSPDHFSTTDVLKNDTESYPVASQHHHGDWYWDEADKEMTFLIDGEGNDPLTPAIKNIKFQVYRCFFENCGLPTIPPPPDGRPSDAKDWSDPNTWGGSVPGNNTDLNIPADVWIIQDLEAPIVMNRLIIDGTLELAREINHKISANIIQINGVLIAGWPDKPMLNNVLISLIGDHNSPDLPISGNLNLGSKAIGVFGLLQLYGKPHKIHWTRLETTLVNGSSSIIVVDAVDWAVGDEIAITTTTFEPKQTEKFIIISISSNNKEISLDRPAMYIHTASQISVDDYHVTMSAKVGLLTRNIKIEGADNPVGVLTQQFFGCRVLVSSYTSIKGIPYVGKAQLSEVEFFHCGQLGYTEKFDPRLVSCSQ